jgi:hypothetical protein
MQQLDIRWTGGPAKAAIVSLNSPKFIAAEPYAINPTTDNS